MRLAVTALIAGVALVIAQDAGAIPTRSPHSLMKDATSLSLSSTTKYAARQNPLRPTRRVVFEDPWSVGPLPDAGPPARVDAIDPWNGAALAITRPRLALDETDPW